MFKGKISNIKKFQCENECWRWDRVESMYKFTLFEESQNTLFYNLGDHDE